VGERVADRRLGDLAERDAAGLVVGTWAASATCQAIASPSRSRSVARKTASAPRAAFSMSETCFLRSSEITYSGAKSWSTSTPNLPLPGFSGRSRTWPYEARTR
jgi:hypothetical protein